MIYIFTYCFNLADFFPKAMLLNSVCMVAGALLMKPAIHAIKDSNRTFIIVMALSVGINLLFWSLCTGMGAAGAAVSIQYQLLFVIFGIRGLLMGIHLAFMGVLMPNVIEFGAWKNKKYQPGMIYSFSAICLTLGGAVGGQFMGILLAGSGYVAPVDGVQQIQSAGTLQNMLWIAFVVPAIMIAAQLVIQLFFGLTDRQCNRYALENQQWAKVAAE